jgi:prepilin-type N-terminal cleavage/methylation domain-containing protein
MRAVGAVLADMNACTWEVAFFWHKICINSYVLYIKPEAFAMKNNFGFTLMELMIAIAIVAILSVVAVPNMIEWRNNAQFNSAVRQIKIAIEETRMDAIKANMRSRISFNVGADSFDREKWDLASNAYATPLTHELPPGVTIASSTFTSDELEFSSRGMANNGTLTLQGTAGQTRDIVVTITGSSRIE